jgi:hypothetical protein
MCELKKPASAGFFNSIKLTLQRQEAEVLTAATYDRRMYVVDNLCNSDRALAAWNCYVIYHGRPDSHFAGHCRYRGAGTDHSRKKDSLSREIPVEPRSAQ